MTDSIATIELARIYESQGYYEEALSIYRSIEAEQPANATRAAVNRIQARISQSDTPSRPDQTAEMFSDLISMVQSDESDPAASDEHKSNHRIESGRKKVALTRLMEEWLSFILLEDSLSRITKIKTE